MARSNGEALALLAPIVTDRKGEFQHVIDQLRAQGYLRARIDGQIMELDDQISLDAKKRHTIEVVVDRFKVRADIQLRLAESFETATQLADGTAMVTALDGSGDDQVFSTRYACSRCGYSIPEMEPNSFSFNSPRGACQSCDGLGVSRFFDPDRVVTNPELSLSGGAIRGWDKRNPYYHQMIQSLARHYQFDVDTVFNELATHIRDVILHGSGEQEIEFTFESEKGRGTRRSVHAFEGILPNLERRYRETESNAVREELSKLLSRQRCDECKGARLNEAARHVLIGQNTVSDIVSRSIVDALSLFETLKLEGQKREVALRITEEIALRLRFLVNVGLDYLSLDRSAETLSGGEAQRIRLASQIGAGLQGVLYVLDEPSIGLHQRDNDRLLKTLIYLRDLGNTVIVVEHDEEAIRAADHVLDIGPGAGVHGGQIVAYGTPQQIMKSKASLTGQYLSGKKFIAIPKRRAPGKNWISVKKASGNNLQSVDVKIPIGLCTVVTGVSGSGKSTLVNDTIYRYAATHINRARQTIAPVKSITGLGSLDKIVAIDQSAIGRTPRSNPATYSGLFSLIRELFAGTHEARSRGYQSGRFSFNVKGGRCEACQGDGLIKVEMHFLPDVYVPCDVCRGKRYNRETLDIRYKGENVHEVLSMTVEQACEFFEAVPNLHRKLRTLMDVGLSYITLGQNSTTLSGGEAQRIKLARELSKRDTGNTLYILDEPTTGLHFEDVKALLSVLATLRDAGNTIIIIEHNLEVVKTADWVVDLGPEGGSGGGNIVAYGTPEEIAKCKASYTGQYLQKLLTQSSRPRSKVASNSASKAASKAASGKPESTKPAAKKRASKKQAKAVK